MSTSFVRMEMRPVEIAMAMGAAASLSQFVVDTGKRMMEGERPDQIARNHMIGVITEMAFAKWLGVYYAPKSYEDRFKGDVLGHEVRGVEFNPRWPALLKVKRNEPYPERRFVMAVWKQPDVQLWGWLLGTEAQQMQKFFRALDKSRPPEFFIPHEKVHSMDHGYSGWGRVRSL